MKAEVTTAGGFIRRCHIRPIPKSPTTMCWRCALIFRGRAGPQPGSVQPVAVPTEYSVRDGVLERTQFHARPLSAQFAKNPPRGIVARVSSRALRIAAPATRRRRFSGATRIVPLGRGLRFRAGLHLILPTIRARVLVDGPKTTSFSTSGPARTNGRWPPGQGPKPCLIPHRG